MDTLTMGSATRRSDASLGILFFLRGMVSVGCHCLIVWALAGGVFQPLSPPRGGNADLHSVAYGDDAPAVPAIRRMIAAATPLLEATQLPPPPGEEPAEISVAHGAELLARGSFQEASAVLEEVLASKNDSHEARLHLAEALLQLAEDYQEKGEHRRAVAVADRLLELGRLTEEAKSFVLNRRGIYLMSAGDYAAARESYELALRYGQPNRHALYNLALLLHYSIFLDEPYGFDILQRAIELYRAALGRDEGAIPAHNTAQSPTSWAASNFVGDQSRHRQQQKEWMEHHMHEARDASTPLSPTPPFGQHAARSGAGRSTGPEGKNPNQHRDTTHTSSTYAGAPGGGPIERNDGIGGPVDKASISRDLAAALSLAGRPAEAVVELQHALERAWTLGYGAATVPDGNQPAPPVLTGTRAKDMALLWDRLAGARSDAGDVIGGVAAGRLAVELAGSDAGLYHNLGVVLQKAGLLAEAEEAWLTAVALDPGLAPALASLGHVEGAKGNIEGARRLYKTSLAASTHQGKGVNGGEGSAWSTTDGVLTAMFLVATAVVPALYDSNEHITQVHEYRWAPPACLQRVAVRQDFERGLDELLNQSAMESSKLVETPRNTVGSGSLGYYIIYQGFEDLDIRRKLARAYWRLAPSVRYCAPFLTNGDTSSAWREPRKLHEVQNERAGSPSKLSKLPAPASAYREGITPHETRIFDEESSFALPCRQRRLRVGFLSAFFVHHSVGLLTEGVVTRLDRSRFETTAIFLQPHPKSAGGASRKVRPGEGADGGDGDGVYEAVRRRTEHVLDIPSRRPAVCHHAIAALELDVLVFTEVGMNFDSYFLSFARLARRSALFWGHAVTSGVSSFDGISTRVANSEATKGGPVGVIDPREVGGIDYFVSSWLFEDKQLGRHAQRKYSERLYLMEGLTSRFTRPPPPETGIISRKSLGIPPRPSTPLSPSRSRPDSHTTTSSTTTGHNDAGEIILGQDRCGALYLVPQTLYKIHPDFDRIVAGVLKADSSGCVVFIRAEQAVMTERLTRRLSRVLLAAGLGHERVLFVRRLGLGEFSGLVEIADVVLDPFPVGGGRSSLEVFAVGTPIVMLYNRTSILQLTYGMYATMDLEGPLADLQGSNTSVSLVTYSRRQFIRSAVAIATDPGLNERARGLILANNFRLYEQDSVVTEWEAFLEGISRNPRPLPHERHDFAVDASNFPGTVTWCSGDEKGRTKLNRTRVAAETVDIDGRVNALQENSRGASDLGSGFDARDAATDALNSKGRSDEVVRDDISAEDRTIVNSTPVRAGEETTPQPGQVLWPFNMAKHATDEVKLLDRTPRQSDTVALAEKGGRHGRELRYTAEFSAAPLEEGGPFRRLLAKVYEGDDAMVEAKKLRKIGDLDYIQYRWVGAVLCRGIGRLDRPVVWSSIVRIDDGPRALLEVRRGDDLYQVARWHCRRYSLGYEGLRLLSARLEQELPQHQDADWISSRAEDRACSASASENTASHNGHTPLNNYANTEPSESGLTGKAAVSSYRGASNAEWKGGGGCVTLAVTTCKRLRGFLGTVEGLQALLGPLPNGPGHQDPTASKAERSDTPPPSVCQVIVVDDGSSAEDRNAMMTAFPRFTFVFKGPGDEKGHAASMNLILSLTKTRFLLYVEDDWWPVNESKPPPKSGEGDFLWRALEVLKNSAEHVSQILINDQSSRSCALGDVAKCPRERQGVSAGWKRFTPAVAPKSHKHAAAADPEIHGADESSRDQLYEIGGVMGVEDGRDSGGRVEYRLHEFGLMYPSHGFAHWPGFSLNPALWDLKRLTTSYQRQFGQPLRFDPMDARFEQTVSMELCDAGIAVAHLPDVTFRHVGGRQSAYEANGMRRPWDTSRTPGS